VSYYYYTYSLSLHDALPILFIDRSFHMTKIGLIRHGCTDWNKAKRAQGHSDIPLCDEGYVQSEKLADRLAGEAWDIIYASDLKRSEEHTSELQSRFDLVCRL